jgi:hypothetical protein
MHVLLEGQTESELFERLFRPYWEGVGWLVTSSVVVTKRLLGGAAMRGGVARWAKLKQEIDRLLGDSHFDVVTTIIDYYGLPVDSPGMGDRPTCGTSRERVEHVEAALASHFSDRRFVPHLSLHESETWVFAARVQLAALAGSGALHRRMEADVNQAGGPEGVNDGPNTAPAKRIASFWPAYSKTSDGPRAVAELGLSALRAQCPHLDAWLASLDSRLV